MKELSPEVEQFVRTHPSFLQLQSQTADNIASRSERRSVFFAVIADAPVSATMQQAKCLLDTALNVIEEQFSGVPYAPQNWRSDGRMYPAGEDFRRKMPTDLVACYFHRQHESQFGANGSFRILERHPVNPKVLMDRPGRDGLFIGDLLEKNSQQSPRISS